MVINYSVCTRYFDGTYHYNKDITKDIFVDFPHGSNLQIDLTASNVGELFLSSHCGTVRLNTLTLICQTDMDTPFILDFLKGIKVKSLRLKLNGHIVICSEHPIKVISVEKPLSVLETDTKSELHVGSYIDIVYGNLNHIDGTHTINHLVVDPLKSYPTVSDNVMINHYYGNGIISPNSYIYGTTCVDGDEYLDLSKYIGVYQTPLRDLVSYVL